jgi:hypothetical protein
MTDAPLPPLPIAAAESDPKERFEVGQTVFYIQKHSHHPGLYLPRAAVVAPLRSRLEQHCRNHVLVQAAQCSSPIEREPMWRHRKNVFGTQLACERACLQRKVEDARSALREAFARLRDAKAALALVGALPEGEDPTP